MQIGVLGGGQLSRMMALAAYPLGMKMLVLEPAEQACAGDVCAHLCADYQDQAALDRLIHECDVVTWDFENVPVESVEYLQQQIDVFPAVSALATGQDRLHEKTLFHDLGLRTPQFMAVDSRPDLLAALDKIGLPAVLKTRRMGYDGKGQAVLRTHEDLEPAWQQLGGQALILEAFVPFDFECSIIGVRGQDGSTDFYPITKNLHHQGVLSLSLAPMPTGMLDEHLVRKAQDWMRRLLDHFDYCGVLTLELFVAGDQLLVNEMAPRVHNSGHWTQNGAVTSQFENHIRAIAGLPLGSCEALGASLMLNWVGELPPKDTFLSIPGLHWHDYGKEMRAGRKLGHANLVAADHVQLRGQVKTLQSRLSAGQWRRLQQLFG